MPVDVHSLLVLDTFQHGINHDEAACASHSSTAMMIIIIRNVYWMDFSSAALKDRLDPNFKEEEEKKNVAIL